jgi:hypothetical protein
MFPNCKQAPLKDVFHRAKGILNETTGFSHPLHESFCEDLLKAVLKWVQWTLIAAESDQSNTT